MGAKLREIFPRGSPDSAMSMELRDDRPPREQLNHAALAASEARFRNIIEQNVNGILVVQPDGMIVYVNPAASRLLHQAADELAGRHFGIPIIPGETTEVDLPLAQGEVRVAEMRVVETEWEGQPVFLASLRDISDRKRLEEELRQKVDELAEADRRKDEFLAMLSHELRNPLAPILNAVHIIRLRGEDPVVRARMRDVVEQQVRCMTRLVDDLLDVSRITRGKIHLHHEPVTLSVLIQHSLETVRPVLESKQHQLQLSLPDEPIHLWADPLRLEQVLNNLLSNAAKYTDPGGLIQVRAEVLGHDVSIQIRDNGIGIAPEMVDEIFHLFSQVNHSLARSQGGLGIGLTLARNLVRLHEGTLIARSDGLGKGSEFIIRLPHRKSFPQDEGESSKAEAKPDRHSCRVLVVEDNVQLAESLCLIVNLWGHECRVSHSGAEAIKLVEVFKPGVVLLDIGLPGMDGYAVAEELRNDSELKGITVIAMTGYGRDEDRMRSRSAGFDHHLVKPLDLDALELLLARLGGDEDSTDSISSA